jgi:hypothetical protein
VPLFAGCAIAHVVVGHLLAAESRLSAQGSPFGICGQSFAGTVCFQRQSFGLPPSASFHRCSICTRGSSGEGGGWAMDPLAAQCHRNTVLCRREVGGV